MSTRVKHAGSKGVRALATMLFVFLMLANIQLWLLVPNAQAEENKKWYSTPVADCPAPYIRLYHDDIPNPEGWTGFYCHYWCGY
jgi:hypothetical protein